MSGSIRLLLPMMKMDPGRSGPMDSPVIVGPAAGRKSITLVWVLSVALLVSSGIAYRLLAAEYRRIVDGPVALPVPLVQFPRMLNGWVGEDLSIPEITQEYMRTYFADDYFSRRYKNDSTGQWANLYVVYCSSQPSGILGHNPAVCYPVHGWIQDRETPSQFATRSELRIDCLVRQFHKSSPGYQETIVLNFYVVNGRIRAREQDFSGFWSRLPNIAGDRARYVAQVQVSSTNESWAQSLARDLTDTILSFLPNVGGKVGEEAGLGQPWNGSK